MEPNVRSVVSASQALPVRGRLSVRRRRPIHLRLGAVAVVAMLLAGCNQSSTTAGPSGAAQSGGGPGASGSALPSAGSAGPTAAPTPSTDQPSVASLIQSDVDAGKIDQNTGLLYRIEATVGAPGLPSQYASAPATEDGAAFDIAALTLDAMPAAIHDQILPYLVRPTDPRSVFHGNSGTSSVGGLEAAAMNPLPVGIPAVEPGDVACGSDGWASVTSASIPVTVWGECGSQGRDDADLTRALAAIEATYADEVRLMGDPVPDDGTPDAGGSPNIDIYLVDRCVTRDGKCWDLSTTAAAVTVPTTPFVGPEGSRKSSGFIICDRNYAGSSVDLESILTHEMFHVLENAHNLEGRVQDGHSYWMTEASAKWAEDFFVPAGRSKWVYPWLNAYQRTDLGLTTRDGTNEYRSFIWPYFMEQEVGAQSIGDVWKRFEGLEGWPAFNATLAGSLPFKDHFADFATRAWDTDLPGGGTPDLIAPRFQALDSGMPKTQPSNPTKFFFKHPPALKKTDPAVKVPETMPPLSERYAELELDDSIQQLVVDFSGLQPQGPLDVTALVHIKGGQWKKETLPKGKTTWCRSQEDVDRVLFVLDDSSYSANSTIAGDWQFQALSDACSPGHFNVTLKILNPNMKVHLGQDGSYEGDGDVDCSLLGGKWSGTFGTGGSYYVDNVAQVEIHDGPNASIYVITAFLNDEPAWFVQQGFAGSVTVDVQDLGKNNVTLTAHGTNQFEQIDASLTCSTVFREEPASS
jgi:hypothetical protein